MIAKTRPDRLGGGLTYWLNRNLSVNAGYDYSERDSNQAGEDFKVNQVSVGVTLRL
ncbi:MAG: outer membrane beta-barrel protein [Rhizobiales bacterium]|nr:outer membrane beta-barrel protein [Hyphomicrobiales bacterium]